MSSSNGSSSITKKRIRQKTASAAGRIKIPACDSCHTRKVKCQRERPCLNCIRYGVNCVDSTNVLGNIATSNSSAKEIEALKAQVAQLQSLLRERSNSTTSYTTTTTTTSTSAISSGDQYGTVNPVAGYGVDEEGVTDITACMKKAGLVTGYDEESGENVDDSRKEFWFADISISYDGELPDILFPPKSVGDEAFNHFKTGVFLFNRLSNVKSLQVTFDNVYSNCKEETDRPSAPATPDVMLLYMALITALTTDTPLSSALYKAAKPILRLMWSHLSVENLYIIMMEVIFLGFTGRLDEAWLALGVACRSAQAMGLHREDGSLMVQWDEETKDLAKSLWWEIYMHDRWYSLCFGRPLMIRDKDCNVGLPTFSAIERKTLPPWQPAAFEYSLSLSRIAGKITKKLSTTCSPSSMPFAPEESSNPFRMSTEKLGEKLHDELVQYHVNLPDVLRDPTNNPAALVIALKYENIRCMLFRRFLTHPTAALRQHAQDQVFSSALAITQICQIAKDLLHAVPCGTLTIIILTGAVAVASYLRVHRGEEDPRALEAKRCLEVLATSLGCMRFPKGPNPLAMKNWNLMNRIIKFSESNDESQNIVGSRSPEDQQSPQSSIQSAMSPKTPPPPHQQQQQQQFDEHSNLRLGQQQAQSCIPAVAMAYGYQTIEAASQSVIGNDIVNGTTANVAHHSLLEMLENSEEWKGIMDYDMGEEVDVQQYMDPFSEAFLKEIESQPHESWFAVKAH